MTGPRLRVISLGAGVQSTTMALMAACDEFPYELNLAIFADTGDEKRGTYRHLDWLEERLTFPLRRLQRFDETLSEATVKHYAENGGTPFTPPFFYEGGMLPKRCSKEWKTRAVTGEIRRRLHLAAGERAPKGLSVEVWLGIRSRRGASDEALRSALDHESVAADRSPHDAERLRKMAERSRLPDPASVGVCVLPIPI